MKKLQLKKEVVESLNSFEQMKIRGGDVSEIGDTLISSMLMSCITKCQTGCNCDPGGPGVPKTNADMVSCRDYPGYTEGCGGSGGGSGGCDQLYTIFETGKFEMP